MRKVISIICALALMLGCVSASAVTFSESKLAEIQGNGSAIAPNTVLASEDFDGYGGPITDSNSSPNRCEDKLSASTTSNFTWGNNSHGSSYTQTNGNAENCNFQYNAFKAVGGTSRHIETLTFNSPINSGVVEWSFSFRVTSNQSGKKLNITKAPNYNSLIKFDSGKIYVNGSETAEEYTYTNTTWMDFKFIIDFDNLKWNAFIGNARIGTENMDWHTSKTLESVRFDFMEPASYGFSFMLDNILVERAGSAISKYSTIASNNYNTNTEGVSDQNKTANNGYSLENGALKITEAEKKGSGLYRVKLVSGKNVVSGKVVIEFDTKVNGIAAMQYVWNGTGDCGFGRYLSMNPTNGDGKSLFWTSANRVVVNNTDYSVNGPEFAEYVPDRWYSIHMAIDLDNDTIDMAVDGEYIIRGTKAMTEGSNSCQLQTVTGFELFIGCDSLEEAAVCYIDNMKMYTINDLGTVVYKEYCENQTAGTAFVAQENWTAVNAKAVQSYNGKFRELAVELDATSAEASLSTPSAKFDGTAIVDFAVAGEGTVSLAGNEIVAVNSQKAVNYRAVASGTKVKIYAGDIFVKELTLDAALTEGSLTFTAASGSKLYVDRIKLEKAGAQHYEFVRTPVTKDGESVDAVTAGDYSAGVTVYNYTAEETFNIPMVIVASYDSNGVLSEVKYTPAIELANGTSKATVTAPEGGSVKSFLWNGLTEIVPQAEPVVLK